jgi:hypothetical protein
MRSLRLLSFIVCMSLPVMGALLPGPPSMAQLQKDSDVIVMATLASIDDSQGFEAVQLDVSKVIQGQPGSLSIRAVVPPSSRPGLGNRTPAKVGLVPRSLIGKAGIWFLKSGGSGWQVIPLDSGSREQIHTSIPADLALDAPSGTVNQQLLAWLVRWYQSLPSPPRVDQDFRLLRSLDAADPKDAKAAITPLLASLRTAQNGLGLAAAIRLGSVEALATIAQRTEELRSNPKLLQITDAIGLYFKPDGPPAIPALQQIAALHSDVAGLDAAVGSALQKIGTKDVLPAMALLLDSHDPKAQLRASWFFSYFATFTDKNGKISGSGMGGPFDSPAVRQQMPSNRSQETPAEYAQFWRSWWSTNKGSFGFQD